MLLPVIFGGFTLLLKTGDLPGVGGGGLCGADGVEAVEAIKKKDSPLLITALIISLFFLLI